jgi:hypothetical protein
MSQMRITKQRRTARVGRRGQAEPEFSLDLRDPDIVRAKQLRRLARGTISGRTTPAS